MRIPEKLFPCLDKSVDEKDNKEKSLRLVSLGIYFGLDIMTGKSENMI